MENRTLIIGDGLLGENGEAAHRCAELLLCHEANRPIQFSINASVSQTVSNLRARLSTDVIGKKPGRVVLGLGYRDLAKGLGFGQVFEQYRLLVDDILSKTSANLHLLTIPLDMLPLSMDQLEGFNGLLRGVPSSSRIRLDDFAAHAEVFKAKQLERGKFGRSIYTEEGMPTSLCNTLLALFLQHCILEEIK